MKLSNIVFFGNNLTSWDIQVMSLLISIIKPAYINEKNCVFPFEIQWVCWHEWEMLNHRHHDYYEKECSKCGHEWNHSLSKSNSNKAYKKI